MQWGSPVHVFGLANLWSNANELIDDLDGTGWIFCQHASKEGLLLALVLWVELMLTGSVQRRAAMNHDERSSPGSVRYPRGLFKKT